MGKIKRKKQRPKTGAVYNSDDDGAFPGQKDPDPTSDDFFQDEVDEFHANQDKILLDQRRPLEPAGFSSDEQEEILGIDDSDEDDEMLEEYERRLHKFKMLGRKDELGSDVEEEENDNDIPDDKAWGKKRSEYYGADVGDNEKIDFYGDTPGAALLEEKEALAIQKRMAEQLEEDDFGLEIFKQMKKPDSSDISTKEKIIQDLSKLSKKEKLKLLKKESPELLDLIEDYKTKMTEVQDRLLPVENLIKQGRLPSSSGALYVQTKLRLLLNYCVNITFYLMLKAKHTPVHNHPVIGRLVQYRNLIKQLEPSDSKAEDELNELLERINNGEEFPVVKDTRKDTSDVIPRSKVKPILEKQKMRRKKVSELLEESDEEALEDRMPGDAGGRTWGRKRPVEETEDLDFSSRIQKEQEGDEDMEEQDEGNEQEDARRSINYQIEKNKGLTPKRKRENRNPRVKHRLKYKKAKIRRKGQVREPRTEINQYAGEISGIRAGVKRGVRLH